MSLKDEVFSGVDCVDCELTMESIVYLRPSYLRPTFVNFRSLAVDAASGVTAVYACHRKQS